MQGDFEISLFCLIFCTIISFLISTIWFGPLLGRQWLEYSHLNQKKVEDIQKENKNIKLVIALIGTLITTIIYSWFIDALDVDNLWELLLLDFFICIGVLFTSMVNHVIWGKTKIQYVLINLGYQFVNLFFQGIIIIILDDDDDDEDVRQKKVTYIYA